VYPIARQIKALKNFKPTETGTSEHFQARNTLGKAFGTKKAKAAIQAHERNKVDVSAMEDVAGVLQDRIDEGTENLPTQGVSSLPPFLMNIPLTSKDGQKKWKNRQMLRVSYLRTTRTLKDRKTFIRCIISSQRRNGPP
jgi:A49-like RNA polymerase I associated factor